MVEFLIGASGTGKTTLMLDRIKNSSDREQIVLVPEQYSTEFDKKLYFHVGAKAFNELLSLTFSSLARQLFQIYGDPDRKGEYADDMARLILIYQAITAARNSPEQLKFFAKSSTRSGFAEESLKLIGDMKKAGISPQSLMLGADKLESRLHDKVTDIASIFYEYEFLMEQYGFKDHLENIREAAKTANLHSFFKGKRVFIDEFESFTADQIDMLKVIFSLAEDTVITLRTDDVNAGEFTLFETVNSTYRQLSRICKEMNLNIRLTELNTSYRFKYDDLRYLSERAMRNIPNDPQNAPEPKNIRIFEARDMYSEAEYVCAELRRLVFADKSLKFKDIAILSNNIEDYAYVLKAAFERYDIPYFLSTEQPVVHTAVMVFFLSLLELLTAKKFKSEQVFRLLKCGMLEAELTEISQLENYCYKWGIDGDVWTEPFTAEDEESDTVEALRSRVITPVMKLKKKLSKELSAEEMCRILYSYLIDSNAGSCLGNLINRLIKSNKDNEAAELKRLWGCLMDILDSAAETLGEAKMSFSDLADILRSMIGQITYSVPPRTLDAVIAASARTARLSSTRVIFVMGACEGDFPNQVSLHGLFTEGDKQKLSLKGLDIARPLTDLIASERLIVYKSLSTASERLYLSYPLSDLSGQAKYAARIIEQIGEIFNDSCGMFITENSLTPDFYAVTKKSAYYHYMQNRSKNTAEIASIKETLLADDEYCRKLALALSKTGQSPKYHISTEIMEALQNFEPLYLSPSALERYNRCHFMHFCESILSLRMPEKIDLDRRISGELSHSCFKKILGSRTKSEFISMTLDQLKSEINAEASAYRKEKLAGDFGKTPRFELFFNKLTESLGDVFLHTKYSLMQSDFVPNAFEMKIDSKSSVKLEFGKNKQLLFGGIIDRTDICNIGDEKYLRIVDYKSSKKVIDESTLASGVDMQMLLYLFAVTEDRGEYADCKPAGVLYTPLKLTNIELDDSKIEEYNQSAVDHDLKTTGLLIDNVEVLEKMEHGIVGKFIPAKLKNDGSFYKNSSVISANGMDKLRDFSYRTLTEAAESIYSGNIEAVPLKIGKKISCKYCSYFNICGNGNGGIYREPDKNRSEEAALILGNESEEE